MLQNYFRLFFRTFHKNIVYHALNLAGLTVGFTAFLMIWTYLYYENSFEQFHAKAENIYRLTVHYTSANGYDTHFARVSEDWTKTIPNEIPEVKQLIRFQNQEPKFIRIGEEKFMPEYAYSTDAAVFDVFDFKLLKGDPKTALLEPHSVVLTKSLAEKYFGRTDVIGEPIGITGFWNSVEEPYKITGVLEDLPSNTHLPVNMLTSFQNEAERRWWAYSYLLLDKNTDPGALKAKIENLMVKNSGPKSREREEYHLQPLKSIHLHSDLAREIKPNGNFFFVKIFFGVAVVILVIVMINFTNLNSVITMGRAKETGLRKILGAEKKDLVTFALVESLALSFCAAFFACCLFYLLLPLVRNVVPIEILQRFSTVAIGMGFLALVTGFISGSYPAFVQASAAPMAVLRIGKSLTPGVNRQGIRLRKILITGQFTLCILLIGSAIVARKQFKYLNEKNLGLTKDQVVALTAVPDMVTGKYQVLKDELGKIPGVLGVSACMEIPSHEIRDTGNVTYEGMPDNNQPISMDIQSIDHDFIRVMGLELLAGEPIPKSEEQVLIPEMSDEESTLAYFRERQRTYLINETAMHKMGWATPQQAVGRKIRFSQTGGYELREGQVIGVVKDFHQETLKNTVDPLILVHEPLWLRNFLIKISTDRVEENLASIQATWNHLFPQYPCDFRFIDEQYEKLYGGERQQLQLLYSLSGIAMVIAFLGLFGLVAYTLKTRTREIAIRKIFGADFLRIARMLVKEYVLLVIIASAVAVPVSYFLVSRWLETYAYRISVSWTQYLLTIAIILLIPLVTVAYHTLKGMSVNPVDCLRDD